MAQLNTENIKKVKELEDEIRNINANMQKYWMHFIQSKEKKERDFWHIDIKKAYDELLRLKDKSNPGEVYRKRELQEQLKGYEAMKKEIASMERDLGQYLEVQQAEYIKKYDELRTITDSLSDKEKFELAVRKIEKWLYAYPDIPTRREELTKRIETATKERDYEKDVLQSKEISGMPKAGTISDSTFNAAIYNIENSKYGLNGLIQGYEREMTELNAFERWIKDILNELDKDKPAKNYIELHYFQSYTWQEIAQATNYNIENIRKMRKRALQKFIERESEVYSKVQ
ncbi:hypothetical protein [Lutispora sp.]|uniref:hypothetical protein n=1 Tax=Lutispora sp. TaxID=2828727 RepID=UPI0035651F7C